MEFGEQDAQGRMLFDGLARNGPSETRFVEFIVPVATITDEIDDDVSPGTSPPSMSHARHGGRGHRMITVHMKDRNPVRLPYVGRKGRRSSLSGRCCEPDLIVDDKVDGPARRIPGEPAELQQFAHETLTCERRVGVHEQRQNASWRSLTGPQFLASHGRSGRDRRHHDQMGGVRKQPDLQGAGIGIDFRRESVVIRNVAGEKRIALGEIPPFDLGNEDRQGFPKDGCKRCEAPTVHSADDDLRLTRSRSLPEYLAENDRRNSDPSTPKRFLAGHFVLIIRSNSSASKTDS